MYIGQMIGWMDEPFFLVRKEAPGFHILRLVEVGLSELVERLHVLEETPFGLAFEIQVQEPERLGGFCQFSNLCSISAYHGFVTDGVERHDGDGLAVNRDRRQFGGMNHYDGNSGISWRGGDRI